MKNYLIYFFLITTIFFSRLSAFDSNLVLSSQFQKLITEYQEGSQKRTTFTEDFLYYGIPLSMEGGIETGSITIKVFDKNDALRTENHVHILDVSFTKGEDGYLAEVGRSKNMNGKMVVQLAKAFQKLFQSKEMEVIDAAESVQCPLDGSFCKNEALMDLRTMGVITFGKAYYEQFGAKSDDEPNYGIVTQFLRKLKVDDFTYDLENLGKKYPAANKVRQLILDCKRMYHPTSKSLSMEELAKKVHSQSKLSKEKHLLWHRFCDTVFANREKFFSQYTWDVLADPDQDVRLKKLLANYASEAFYFNGDAFKEFVAENGLEKKYPVDEWIAHYPDTYKELHELDCIISASQKPDSKSPHLFSFFSQTSFESRKKMYEIASPFEPIKELRQLLTFIENFQNSSNQKAAEGETQEDDDEINETEILIELIQEYNASRPAILPPGYLYGLWMLSKMALQDMAIFIFTLE